MVSMSELWLPILLSAVFVFLVSSILHMVIPIHKGDYKKIPGEDLVLEQMRGQGLSPGSYMFPCPKDMSDMGTPEMCEKYKRGPVGFLTVVPSGAPGMGKNLVQWFIYSCLISVFVGYTATLGLDRVATYSAVFRLTGTVAILGYALSALPESIWKGQGWVITLKFVFDGLLYGLVTAGTFGWLWPATSPPA